MKSSQETRPARPAGGEVLFVHLWACGERRKGGDARARRARGKRPRRMSKDRSFARDWVRTVGPGRVENHKCSYYVRFSLSWAILWRRAAGRNMTKPSIREFKPAGRGGDGVHPCLDERRAVRWRRRGAFDEGYFWRFRPLGAA